MSGFLLHRSGVPFSDRLIQDIKRCDCTMHTLSQVLVKQKAKNIEAIYRKNYRCASHSIIMTVRPRRLYPADERYYHSDIHGFSPVVREALLEHHGGMIYIELRLTANPFATGLFNGGVHTRIPSGGPLDLVPTIIEGPGLVPSQTEAVWITISRMTLKYSNPTIPRSVLHPLCCK